MQTAYPHIKKQIIAHRGASAYAPENTASAIIKAAQMGLNWIEVDVVISADEQPVIFHDTHLERCSNGQGKLAHTTYDALQKLDFGAWFSPAYAHEPLLSLSTLLNLAIKHNLSLNLEIKSQQGQERATIDAVQHCLSQQTSLPPIVFSSFNINALKQLAQILPTYPRAVLVDALTADCDAMICEVNACGLHFNANKTDTDRIHTQLAQPTPLLAYTVNKATLATELLAFGVTAIFSDYPDLI